MAEGIHSGHRERMLNDFLKNGFDINTPPHKVLEFLLFYCVPRKDTNELAHALINRFGSLSGVLDAPVDELAKFNGLSLRGAALIKLFEPILTIYNNENLNNVKRFNDISEIGDYLFERIKDYKSEKFGVLILGADGKFKNFEIISSGDVSSVNVSIRSLLKLCLDKDGMIIALCHNHPSGVAIPSREDVILTEQIAEAMNHAGLNLIDHIISARNDYVSMAQTREYSHIFCRK